MTSTTAVDSGGRVDEATDFDAFVEARSTRLRRTAYLLTRDRAPAEDLLQTALMKAWRRWGRSSAATRRRTSARPRHDVHLVVAPEVDAREVTRPELPERR